MIFMATLLDRSPRGHYLLGDVEAENGMKRSHCWLNQMHESLPRDTPFNIRLKIRAQYRRYRPGPDGWTICSIRSVEQIP